MDKKDKLNKEEIAQENIDEAASLDDMMAASMEEDVDTADTHVESPTESAENLEETVETTQESENGSEKDMENLDDSSADEGESDTSEDATPTEDIDASKTDAVEDSSEAEKVVEKKKEEKEELAKEENTNGTSSKPAYRGKWYIVHTYSGHENKVAKTLMQRVQAMGFENSIYDALVPTRDTIRVRGGKKETIKEKIFPGYILVNMDLSDEAWVLVRTTPGVTSFVGAQNKPTPIRDDEVQAIVAFVEQKDPVYKAQFSNGEAVKITDGPFSDFLGTVESIDEAKGKVKVLVSIFGRETPVELDFLQVAKI